MSPKEKNLPIVPDDDDEPDDWDKRIFSTGCASECPALWMPIRVLYRTREKLIWTDEQQKLNDCYFHQKDWRKCKKQMNAFRECWKRQGNDQRTESKDN